MNATQQLNIQQARANANCQKVFWQWFFQISVLALLGFLIYGWTVGNNVKKSSLPLLATILFAIFWCANFVFAFFTETYNYLKVRRTSQDVVKYMETLFQTIPTITFNVRCYHIQGAGKHRHQVTTFSDSKQYNFKSVRDISGAIDLNFETLGRNPDGLLVKLHLAIVVVPSKDGTEEQYIGMRNQFFDQNRNKDVCFDCNETYFIQGFSEYNLVSFGSSPCTVNMFFYFFFALIGIHLLYELYVNLFCIEINFNITKEISSFRDLGQKKFNKTFLQKKPTIRLNDQVLLDFQHSERPFNSYNYDGRPNEYGLVSLANDPVIANNINNPSHGYVNNYNSSNQIAAPQVLVISR